VRQSPSFGLDDRRLCLRRLWPDLYLRTPYALARGSSLPLSR
jgi:hypothetical protein